MRKLLVELICLKVQNSAKHAVNVVHVGCSPDAALIKDEEALCRLMALRGMATGWRADTAKPPRWNFPSLESDRIKGVLEAREPTRLEQEFRDGQEELVCHDTFDELAPTHKQSLQDVAMAPLPPGLATFFRICALADLWLKTRTESGARLPQQRGACAAPSLSSRCRQQRWQRCGVRAAAAERRFAWPQRLSAPNAIFCWRFFEFASSDARSPLLAASHDGPSRAVVAQPRRLAPATGGRERRRICAPPS